jgi:hypothetical protein
MRGAGVEGSRWVPIHFRPRLRLGGGKGPEGDLTNQEEERVRRIRRRGVICFIWPPRRRRSYTRHRSFITSNFPHMPCWTAKPDVCCCFFAFGLLSLDLVRMEGMSKASESRYPRPRFPGLLARRIQFQEFDLARQSTA